MSLIGFIIQLIQEMMHYHPEHRPDIDDVATQCEAITFKQLSKQSLMTDMGLMDYVFQTGNPLFEGQHTR